MHDVHSDEDDSFDETIYPLDFQDYEGESGQLKDDASTRNNDRNLRIDGLIFTIGYAQFNGQTFACQV